jgi:sugar (pentulose or hexulose) kinase
MSLALGIDVGTSGVRIAALDDRGRLVATAAVPMAAPERTEAGIFQDAEVWWTATAAALAALGRDADLAQVRAVAVDGTSGTIVAVDAAGRPLAPGRMYNDPSGAPLAARVAAVAPPETAAHGATSPLARAICLKGTPGLARILHQADWIAGRLSGRFDVSDENNALKTGYDPVARRWPDWIATAGLDPALLPEVVPVGTAVGRVTADAARAFGLADDARVVTGTTDGCAAFLATGAATPGDGVTSLGTTLVLKLLSTVPLFAPGYGLYSHRIGDLWLAGGASNSGGAALLKHFTPEAMRALEPAVKPDEPTGLDYYPLPGPGERFPINDPALQPRIAPRPAEDATFFQALLEGIAGVEALGYARLAELGGPALKSVRTVGGGARNAAFTAIRARRLGVPLIAPDEEEAAVGAARLAWRGLGADM